MDKITKIDKLYNELCKAYRMRVIENEHLIKPTFLEFLSCINRVKYNFGGRHRPVIMVSLKVQTSGSGKGVADEFICDLLNHCGYKCEMMNEFTGAGIVGSLEEPEKNKNKNKGKKQPKDEVDELLDE